MSAKHQSRQCYAQREVMKVQELLSKYHVKDESELVTDEQKAERKKIRDWGNSRRAVLAERERKRRKKLKEQKSKESVLASQPAAKKAEFPPVTPKLITRGPSRISVREVIAALDDPEYEIRRAIQLEESEARAEKEE